VPGNAAHNLRRLPLLNTNVADLSFLFTLHTGDRTSAHLDGRECLAVFETNHQTPYFWNLHVGDVGHTLVLGASGSGKSFLLNFLIMHAQKYDPTTVIFDLGGGYEYLTHQLGGSVWRMGLVNRGFTINPFCLPPTVEHRHFLVSFVRVLLQSGGQYRLTMEDDRNLHEAVENIYALDPQRRLFTLANLLPLYSHSTCNGGCRRIMRISSTTSGTPSRFSATVLRLRRAGEIPAAARAAPLLRPASGQRVDHRGRRPLATEAVRAR
jgi:type IV secretion system protein VirB4